MYSSLSSDDLRLPAPSRSIHNVIGHEDSSNCSESQPNQIWESTNALPCPPYTEEEIRIVVTDDGIDWAAVAFRIYVLLGQGYNCTTLPCPYCGATEMDDVLA